MLTFLEFCENDFNELMDIGEEVSISEAVNPRIQMHQPWPNFTSTKGDKQYSKDEFKGYYNREIKPHIDKNEKHFHKMLNDLGHNNIKVARKSIDSLHDKIINRNRPATEIHDALRGAVLTKNDEQSEKIVDKLKATGKVIKHHYKNHEEGGNESGYGGVHHLVMDTNGMQTEVQVMPSKVFDAKMKAHKIYKKYRSMRNPEQHPDYKRDMEDHKAIYKKAISKA